MDLWHLTGRLDDLDLEDAVHVPLVIGSSQIVVQVLRTLLLASNNSIVPSKRERQSYLPKIRVLGWLVLVNIVSVGIMGKGEGCYFS